MEETYKIVITSAFTIAGALIIFTITKIIDRFHIEPYYDFKSELTKIKTLLYLNNNIFTNRFDVNETKSEFIKRVLNEQQKIRLRWAKLLVHYNRISHSNLINLFCKKKIPTSKEVEKIAQNLLYVSNSSLVYSGLQRSSIINDNSLERDKKIKEIVNILMKY